MPAIESIYPDISDFCDKKTSPVLKVDIPDADAKNDSIKEMKPEGSERMENMKNEKNESKTEEKKEDPSTESDRSTSRQEGGILRKSQSVDVNGKLDAERNDREIPAFVAKLLKDGFAKTKRVKDHLSKEHKRRNSTPAFGYTSRVVPVKEADPKSEKYDVDDLSYGLQKVKLEGDESGYDQREHGSHFTASIGEFSDSHDDDLTARGPTFNHQQYPNNRSPHMPECEEIFYGHKVPSPVTIQYVPSPQTMPASPENNLMLLQANGLPSPQFGHGNNFSSAYRHMNSVGSPPMATPGIHQTAIPTVVTAGLHVPHMPEELQKQVAELNQHQCMIPSPNNAPRVPVEDDWPVSTPVSPQSASQGPPSVGSFVESDASMSPYPGPESPAGSTGSMVNSPEAVDQWQNQGSPCGSSYQESVPSHIFIRGSGNTNIGSVMVNPSKRHCGSSGSKDEAINQIKRELKSYENGPLPSINIFSSQPPNNRPTRTSAPQLSSVRAHPYRSRIASEPSLDGSGSMLYPNQNMAPISIHPTAVSVPPMEREFHQGSCIPSRRITIPNPRTQEEHEMREKIMRLPRDQLCKQHQSQDYDGETLLQIMILNGYSYAAICMIERMYQEGISLDTKNQLGQTALLLAVVQNLPDVVQSLVYRGADVMIGGKQGTFPLHYAAAHGFMDIIQRIFSFFTDRQMMMHLRQPEINSFDFEGKTPLICAVETHHTYQEFYVQDQDATQMRMVDNLYMIELLLSFGADPLRADASSHKTPLVYAITDFKLDVIHHLLERSEYITDASKLVQSVMSDGNTPLHIAVGIRAPEDGILEIIGLLYKNGADVVAQNCEGHKPQNVIPKDKEKVIAYFQEKISNKRSR